MLEILLNDIEFGEIPISIVQGWLRSLELPFSGDLADRLQEHFNDGTIDDESIADFLENVKIGGYKTISIFGLPGNEWDVLDLNSFERKLMTISQKARFENFNFEKIASSSANKISFQLSQNIGYYRVKGGKYETSSLRQVNGEYLAPAHFVDKNLICMVEINKTKKKIYVWFDAFAELGPELKLHKRKAEAKDLLIRVMGLRNVFNSKIGANFNRLQNINLCALEKIWKSQKTLDSNGKQTNTSFGLVAGNTDGDPRKLMDATTKAILAESDGSTVTLDYLKLKWLKAESSDKLLRDVHTTVYKDGTVSFHSFAVKSDIEYVLSNI